MLKLTRVSLLVLTFFLFHIHVGLSQTVEDDLSENDGGVAHWFWTSADDEITVKTTIDTYNFPGSVSSLSATARVLTNGEWQNDLLTLTTPQDDVDQVDNNVEVDSDATHLWLEVHVTPIEYQDTDAHFEFWAPYE
ncbi:hypothetical protein K8I28_01870 [bacterium]|nr:hypothetical protein [bacterium]